MADVCFSLVPQGEIVARSWKIFSVDELGKEAPLLTLEGEDIIASGRW